jgi:hypothetical protein
MLIHPLSVVTKFIDELNVSLQSLKPSAQLTTIQKAWLFVNLVGIVVTGMLNWAAFERLRYGVHSQSRLRWMFCWAKIKWESRMEAKCFTHSTNL